MISNGLVHSGWAVNQGIQGSVKADPGTLTGGPPTGQVAADVQGSLRKNVQMENLFGQTGERVWCAQFMELAVNFTNGPERNPPQGWLTRLFPKKHVEVLQLRQVEDLGVSGVRRATTSKDSPSSSIDWKNHQAMIIGLQSTGQETHELVTTDDATDDAASDNDEPLDKMVVTDLPYDQGVSGQDWNVFEDYLAYLEYQN
jgi:hypothetical protein